MGCNIPRPSKRPPTPADKEIMKRAINEPLASQDQIRKAAGLPEQMEISDQLYEWRTQSVIEAYEQFHQAAHELTYDKPRKENVTNCPNCCAVITGPICEYCGTRFPDQESHYQVLRTTDNQEIIIPIYVGGDKIDEVVTRNRTQFRSGGD